MKHKYLQVNTNDDVLVLRDVKSIKTSTDELRITRISVLTLKRNGKRLFRLKSY